MSLVYLCMVRIIRDNIDYRQKIPTDLYSTIEKIRQQLVTGIGEQLAYNRRLCIPGTMYCKDLIRDTSPLYRSLTTNQGYTGPEQNMYITINKEHGSCMLFIKRLGPYHTCGFVSTHHDMIKTLWDKMYPSGNYFLSTDANPTDGKRPTLTILGKTYSSKYFKPCIVGTYTTIRLQANELHKVKDIVREHGVVFKLHRKDCSYPLTIVLVPRPEFRYLKLVGKGWNHMFSWNYSYKLVKAITKLVAINQVTYPNTSAPKLKLDNVVHVYPSS